MDGSVSRSMFLAVVLSAAATVGVVVVVEALLLIANGPVG
jgi:hypothetical protein